MKIRYKELLKALDHIRYQSGSKDDQVVEITMREEDIQNNRLCDSMTVTLTTVSGPGQYDSVRSNVTKEYVLEVFSESENRTPHLTITESRDLDFKKD